MSEDMKTIKLCDLFELLEKYDECYGNYPEHEREGVSVKDFIEESIKDGKIQTI